MPNVHFLELLSDNEVELASVLLDRIVESITPVKSEKTDHRQEYPDTHTGRALDSERVERLDVGPAVTSFEESQSKDCGLWLEYHRIPELKGELVIDITGIVAVGVVWGCLPRGQGIVIVTAEGDDVRTVGVVAGHAVTAHTESFERRIAPVPVVVAEITELRLGHHNQIPDQSRVCLRTYLPFMILDPFVALLRGPVVVVDVLVVRHPDRVAAVIKSTEVFLPEQ